MLFTKFFRKSSQFGQPFSRKNVKRMRSPHKKSRKMQKVSKIRKIDLLI